MLKNKKIAFCINSMEKGGAERVVSILANHFSTNNEVYIITITNKEILYDLNSNINIISLTNNKSIKNGNKLLKKILMIPKIFKRTKELKKVNKKYNFDIIISFLPEASFITMLSKPKSKVIISDRNDPKIEYSSKIYNIIMRSLYPKADAYVFQTEDAKKYFEDIIDFSSKKYEVILNPVDERFICNPYKGIREKKIVSVGRLSEQKNFDLLIDAFNIANKEIEDYRLHIYGEGLKRDELQEKITRLGLENKVKLLGVVDDVKSKIYTSSLFVMSSNYEGMPNALIEAMALGVPVISTNCPCGGPKTLIKNNENGILVDVKNKEQLACNIVKVLKDKELREKIGNNASKITELVNPKIINMRWEELIEHII